MKYVVAHRGLSSKAPENTLESFDLAVSTGSKYIEFDVHLSKDNEVVIIAKTIRENFDLLKHEVIKLHSYENPCIVLIPIEKGQENYISWLVNNCS